MLLRVFLYCCVASGCCVGSVFADELQQIQSQFHSGQGDTLKLLHDVDSYLQQSPNNIEALFLKANLLEQNKDMEQAERLYRDLIKAYPAAPEPYNNLASLLVIKGKLSEAQLLLEKAMRTHSGYATVYDNLSQIYVAMARDSYGKALQLNETSPQISLTHLNTITASTAMQVTQAPEKMIKSTAATNTGETESIAPIVLAPTEKKTVVSKAAQDRHEIITTLEGWAAAWSEQATDVYFIFYVDDYHPPGLSHIAWKKERRIRLNKPRWIQIGLDGIDIKSLTNQEAKVELVQDYRASNYQDKTRKELLLRQTADGWRIVAERNLTKLD